MTITSLPAYLGIQRIYRNHRPSTSFVAHLSRLPTPTTHRTPPPPSGQRRQAFGDSPARTPAQPPTDHMTSQVLLAAAPPVSTRKTDREPLTFRHKDLHCSHRSSSDILFPALFVIIVAVGTRPAPNRACPGGGEAKTPVHQQNHAQETSQTQCLQSSSTVPTAGHGRVATRPPARRGQRAAGSGRARTDRARPNDRCHWRRGIPRFSLFFSFSFFQKSKVAPSCCAV